MYNNCCVLNCESKRKDVKFHRFLKCETGLKKWLSCLRDDSLGNTDNAVGNELCKRFVCHKHFEQKYVTGTLRLRVGAYPTLFSAEEIASGKPAVPEDNGVCIDVTSSSVLPEPSTKYIQNGGIQQLDNIIKDHDYPKRRVHNDHNYGLKEGSYTIHAVTRRQVTPNNEETLDNGRTLNKKGISKDHVTAKAKKPGSIIYSNKTFDYKDCISDHNDTSNENNILDNCDTTNDVRISDHNEITVENKISDYTDITDDNSISDHYDITNENNVASDYETKTIDETDVKDEPDDDDTRHSVVSDETPNDYPIFDSVVDDGTQTFHFGLGKNEDYAETLHEGFRCNECDADIRGFRYSCVQCADYDLCGACERDRKHSRHYVLRIPRPKSYSEIQEVMDTIREKLGITLRDADEVSVKSENEVEQMATESDPLADFHDSHVLLDTIATSHQQHETEFKENIDPIPNDPHQTEDSRTAVDTGHIIDSIKAINNGQNLDSGQQYWLTWSKDGENCILQTDIEDTTPSNEQAQGNSLQGVNSNVSGNGSTKRPANSLPRMNNNALQKRTKTADCVDLTLNDLIVNSDVSGNGAITKRPAKINIYPVQKRTKTAEISAAQTSDESIIVKSNVTGSGTTVTSGKRPPSVQFNELQHIRTKTAEINIDQPLDQFIIVNNDIRTDGTTPMRIPLNRIKSAEIEIAESLDQFISLNSNVVTEGSTAMFTPANITKTAEINSDQTCIIVNSDLGTDGSLTVMQPANITKTAPINIDQTSDQFIIQNNNMGTEGTTGMLMPVNIINTAGINIDQQSDQFIIVNNDIGTGSTLAVMTPIKLPPDFFGAKTAEINVDQTLNQPNVIVYTDSNNQLFTNR